VTSPPIEVMTSTTITGHRIRRRGRHRRASVAVVITRRVVSIMGRLITIALVASLVLAAVIAYGTVDNRWYKVVAVQGGSMSPTIEQGDLVFFMRPDSIEVGDIVILEVAGSIVTHRVVDIDSNGGYVTQGDANPTPDRWQPGEIRIVGDYLFRIPLIGKLFSSGVGAYLTDADSVAVQVESEPAPSS
jgi:signal peptidase I